MRTLSCKCIVLSSYFWFLHLKFVFRFCFKLGGTERCVEASPSQQERQGWFSQQENSTNSKQRKIMQDLCLFVGFSMLVICKFFFCDQPEGFQKTSWKAHARLCQNESTFFDLTSFSSICLIKNCRFDVVWKMIIFFGKAMMDWKHTTKLFGLMPTITKIGDKHKNYFAETNFHAKNAKGNCYVNKKLRNQK